jgi:Ca2+-binding EF-hand superfamily protein
MFKTNGILLSKQELLKIFSVVDYNGTGMLTENDFKKFILSNQSKFKFRHIMREVREKSRKSSNLEDFQEYIPLTFDAMLNYLYTKSERDNIRRKII